MFGIYSKYFRTSKVLLGTKLNVKETQPACLPALTFSSLRVQRPCVVRNLPNSQEGSAQCWLLMHLGRYIVNYTYFV